jgi:aminoglycoside phosphotransferase (APT) family kinase protein
MPSAARYVIQVEREQKCLPRLALLLPLAIPMRLVIGEPNEGYPLRWSIYRWIDGDTVASAHIADLVLHALWHACTPESDGTLAPSYSYS